jgi:OFA family oxalate/formate antiporter-like MFS transporter
MTVTVTAPLVTVPAPVRARPRDRWLVAVAAVAVHLCIGSVYAYSVFKKPLGKLHGWSESEVTLAFSLAIVFLGLTAATGSLWMGRLGPRRCAMLAAAGWGGGLLLAALAVSLGKLWLFWLGYGVIGGVGLGLGYAPPVTALIRWFPDRRGLAAGLGVCGFGFAALLAAPAADALMLRVGVPRTFVYLGLGYGLILLLAALGLRMPGGPAGPTAAAPTGQGGNDRTVGQALRTLKFWLLWTLFFLNICAGITLIALASPFAQEAHGLTRAQAAVLVGLMGVANGTGRLAWSAVSDYLGRPGTFILMFLLQIAVFAALPSVASAPWFEAGLMVILTCYGAGFAIGPAFLADMFGTRHVGAIYGALLTAWSAAALAGPQLGARLRHVTGSYTGVLHAIALGLTLALVLAVLLGLSLARARRGPDREARGSASRG